jgi:2-keto-4-pentenoate hydratase/2-oxohepta-3-ene-1,7-dioic acid hydratase in catechol pathway
VGIKAGDVMRASIEGIGSIENPVVDDVEEGR